MPTVKIGIPYPANGVTIDRFGKRDMVVPYYIDGKGAFEVRLPIEEYTPDKAQQAVEKQARSQIALIDKQIPL